MEFCKKNRWIVLGLIIYLMGIAALYSWQVCVRESREIAAEEKRIAQEIALQESIARASYIGNKNSYKLHVLDCSYLPESQNRVYFEFRAEAIAAGYKPCEKCTP